MQKHAIYKKNFLFPKLSFMIKVTNKSEYNSHYAILVLLLSTIFCPMFPFDHPKNIRKPLVFWCSQGDQKETLETKGLTSNKFH